MPTTRKLRRADGRTVYHVQIRLKDHDSQTATFDRKADAEEWAARTEAALRERRHFPDRAMRRLKFGELIDKFVDSEIEQRAVRDITRLTNQMDWWGELLGRDTPLIDITPARIVECRDRLTHGETISGKPASPATVNRYLAVLSKAMSAAVKEWFWLPDNPCRNVRRPTEPRGRVRFLSDDERERLLEACKKSTDPRLYPLVLAAISTGARQGELLSLRWGDIDFERGSATIEDTKNGDRRAVPVVGLIAEVLQEWGRVRIFGNDRVFAGRKGHTTFPRKAWLAALNEAQIKNFTFHDLRHTAASYLAMSGATLVELATILGHKTLQMVQRYAHLTEQHSNRVALKMANRFLGKAL